MIKIIDLLINLLKEKKEKKEYEPVPLYIDPPELDDIGEEEEEEEEESRVIIIDI